MPNEVALPSKRQLAQYNVNREGWEAIRQDLYDFQPYAAAGANTLGFFAIPQGQAGKTLSDTNLDLAAQLPRNQNFLVQTIEVYFFPTTPTVATDMPAAFGAGQITNIVNDAYIFRRSGNLVFLIGSKDYLREAPLMRFPPKSDFYLEAALADASTAAANLQSRIAYATSRGQPYQIAPASLRLVENQNFGVSLNWPEGLQAITNPARVGIVLGGVLYRRSQ